MSSEGTFSDRNHIQHLLITTGVGSQTRSTAGDGTREVLHAFRTGLISHPQTIVPGMHVSSLNEAESVKLFLMHYIRS